MPRTIPLCGVTLHHPALWRDPFHESLFMVIADWNPPGHLMLA